MPDQDKTLKCKDCGQDFVFTANEQQWFAEKLFTDPVRCRPCRQKKREEREKQQGNGNSRGSGSGGGYHDARRSPEPDGNRRDGSEQQKEYRKRRGKRGGRKRKRDGDEGKWQ